MDYVVLQAIQQYSKKQSLAARTMMLARGPNTGLFIQLIDELMEDLEAPETNYTFGTLIQAQALGDYQALRQVGRRVLRINLERDVAGNLSRLFKSLHD